MSDHYILTDDGSVRLEPDLLTWARWFENAQRHIAEDKLPGGVRVSTVFSGLDWRLRSDGSPPILFETMIFGGPEDGYQDRYATREEAVAGHAKALALAQANQGSGA